MSAFPLTLAALAAARWAMAAVAAAVAAWVLLRLSRWSARHRRARCVAGLLALDATGFELEVGRLLSRHGFRQVCRVGGPGDLTVDLEALDPAGRRVVIQCKRYGPDRRVGSGVVQQVVGMAISHHGADRCILVTTSAFTAPAAELARQHGVELVDGTGLARLGGPRAMRGAG